MNRKSSGMDKYSLKNKSCENSKQLFILRIWISKQNDKFELLEQPILLKFSYLLRILAPIDAIDDVFFFFLRLKIYINFFFFFLAYIPFSGNKDWN